MYNQSNSLITALTPAFEGEYARRFDSLCRDLAIDGLANDPKRRAARIQEEVDWANGRLTNRVDTKRFLTAVSILSDLLSLSWQLHYAPTGLELMSPSPTQAKGYSESQVQEVKQAVRRELADSVRKQIEHPATQDFVRRMEGTNDRSLQTQPITVLVADGNEVASRVKRIFDLPEENREEALRSAVQPYLQLVEPDDRDPYTGIKYGEIWRYFRLTWSIPSTGIPGRQLLYLVRDAAHPFHAVMGIAALSNSAMQVKDRDDYIGWTTDSFTKRLAATLEVGDTDLLDQFLQLLEGYIESGLDDINSQGLVTEQEILNPTEEVINRLRTEVGRFTQERQQALRRIQRSRPNGESNDDGDIEDDELVPYEMADTEVDTDAPHVSKEILDLDHRASERGMDHARRLLVFKKRAFELSRLLSARMVFQRVRRAPDLAYAIDTQLRREEFQTAINSALLAIKKVRIGINMLEITTCGAIPPYNHILGGKLVALLMMSPQVVADYEMRYGGRPSLIASQLRNEEVVRPSHLVYLGTTSLYGVGSSQYNRLSLPAQIFHPDQPELQYKPIGQTSGFGTVQFSQTTSRALTELETLELGYQDVNSIFGEGFSPKLRKMRSGLANLGFDPEVILRHNQPRLLYAVELCSNAREYLRGEDDRLPDYITQSPAGYEASEAIVDFWRRRWLFRRIQRADVLERLESFDGFTLIVHPNEKVHETHEVQNQSHHQKLEGEMPVSVAVPQPRVPSVSVEFVQKLYRDTSAYSDQLDDQQRAAINIATALEQYVLQKLDEGYSIILTGNAGDGKTHILTRLQEQIRATGAYVILDASVVLPGEIIEVWQAALENNVPFCMAANEWPLHILIRDYRDTFPLLNAVRQQLDSQLVYGDMDETLEIVHESGLIVIDLGKRNHLQPQFFEAALEAVLRGDLYEQCPRCPFNAECDASRNRRFLREEQVSQRLGLLVSRLAVMGHHVTVRELLAMISYTIFGGRTCTTLASTSGRRAGFYADQIFDPAAKGVLFDLLRQHTDPAMISHPHWDVKLYYNEYQTSDWIHQDNLQLIYSDRIADPMQQRPIFEHVKRRFYFEHRYGEQVLDMVPEDERAFRRLVDPGTRDVDDILDDILVAINHFFCPVLKDNDAKRNLYVWTSHRYDERVPKAFLCEQRVNRDPDLEIQWPQLAPHLVDAFVYYPDHVRLVAYPNSDDPRYLNIDFSLFKVLRDVQRGLPPMLAPDNQTIRLYQFMNALQAVRPESRRERHTILSYVTGSRSVMEVTVHKASREISFAMVSR